MSLTAEQTHELLRELLGTRCFCGAKKRARQTFCRTCFFRLPPAIGRALYHRFGEGYEDAYQAARNFLSEGSGK